MRRFLAAVILSVALLFGCSAPTVTRTQSVDGDFETMQDGVIMLSGAVDEDTYKEFYRATLTGAMEYTIIIHTHGGDAYSTVAIMNHIEQMQAKGVKFKMIVPAIGSSAGAYIFMMGDERIMHRPAQLMWHTMVGQNAFDGRKIPSNSIDMINYLDQFVVAKFTEKFPHLSEEFIYNLLWNSGMTWMTEYEARRYGIATRVID